MPIDLLCPRRRTELRLRAYAKINLTLDVFSKRPDGYHGIASVMQAISLYDTLLVKPSAEPGVVLTCDGPESDGVPTNAENLVVQAASRAIESRPGTTAGVAIHLHKRTPSQAGLGGGSSDAAAARFGVNRLLG